MFAYKVKDGTLVLSGTLAHNPESDKRFKAFCDELQKEACDIRDIAVVCKTSDCLTLKVDASELHLGLGGLELWLNCVHDHIHQVHLEYGQSALAEILQHIDAADRYGHPYTRFLYPVGTLIDEEFVAGVARELAGKYHYVLWGKPGSWNASTLEFNLVFGAGESIEECIRMCKEAQVVAITYCIRKGNAPPKPKESWGNQQI